MSKELLKPQVMILSHHFLTNWVRSYLSDRSFRVNIKCKCSYIVKNDYVVLQRSFLGPLLFLLYVNGMNQAVDCALFLYADSTCWVYQHKGVKDIERNLNKNFSEVCDWFVYNKLSILLEKDQTKYILSGTKHRLTEAAIQRCSYKKVLRKYEANLQENTYAEVRFQQSYKTTLLKSHSGMGALL